MELHAENWKRVEVWWGVGGGAQEGLPGMGSGFQRVTKPKYPHGVQVGTQEGLDRTLWNLEPLLPQFSELLSSNLSFLPFPHGQVVLELTLPLHLWAGSSGSWDADTGMSYSCPAQSSWPHVISTEQAWDSRSYMFTFDLPSLSHNSLSRCSICLNAKVMQKEIAARGHQMRTKIEWELDKVKDNVSSSGFCLLPVGQLRNLHE